MNDVRRETAGLQQKILGSRKQYSGREFPRFSPVDFDKGDGPKINENIYKINQCIIDSRVVVQDGLTLVIELNKEFGKKEKMNFIYIIIFSFLFFRKENEGLLIILSFFVSCHQKKKF